MNTAPSNIVDLFSTDLRVRQLYKLKRKVINVVESIHDSI